jgi:medium-chain acyl-[acyl-carrier-protein] hydrolase
MSKGVYSPLVQPNSTAHMRLFCFPYAGGRAAIYRDWMNRLPGGIEVVPIELPGRGMRMAESPQTRIEPAVRALAETLSPLLDRPFAFFGHSMGALISFELSRLLYREYRVAPEVLMVSAHRAPQLPDLETPTYLLPHDLFVQKLRYLNGTPPEVLEHPELLAYLVPLLRADFEVCNTYSYRPGEILPCPIAAFGGLQDPSVTVAQLQGWQNQTSAEFSLEMLPGDHFYLNESRHLLLRLIRQRLDELALVAAA